MLIDFNRNNIHWLCRASLVDLKTFYKRSQQYYHHITAVKFEVKGGKMLGQESSKKLNGLKESDMKSSTGTVLRAGQDTTNVFYGKEVLTEHKKKQRKEKG